MTLGIAIPFFHGASAVTDLGNGGVFQLDGTIHKTASTTFPTNWDALFSSSGTALALPPGGLDSAFVNDAPLPDTTTFITGIKDIANLPNAGWQCTSANNVTPKDKILDVYSFAIMPSFGSRAGHLLIYGGYERFANSGAGDIGIWLFQDPTVNCSSNKGAMPFSGNHTVGDILLTAEFSTGGAVTTLNAFKWVGTGGNINGVLQNVTSTGANDCTTALVTANFCARSNSSPITTPWPAQDKTSAPNTLAPAEFFDVGVDLTGLLGPNPPCINRFLFDSRSSPSPTSDLHDFALGSLSTCPKAHITTSVSPTPIAVNTSASDTANVTLTSSTSTVSGTVDFKVYGPVSTNNPACTTLAASFTGIPISGTGSALANSGSFTPSAAGYYFWTATYNPATARNGNTVSTPCGDTGETLLVISSSITTSASNPVALGSSVTDTATVTLLPSGQTVAGTIDFTVYGPVASNSPTCMTVAASFTGVAIGPGVSPQSTTSPAFTPSAAGYYFWIAKYNPAGPANGNSATSTCGATAETTVVIAAHITTTVSPNVITFSGSATDTATVTLLPSGQTVAGTIDFAVYGPVASNSTPLCTTVVASFTGVPIGPGVSPQSATSPSFSPKAVGFYFWTAKYNPSGAANGNSVSTSCGDSGETLQVVSIPKITAFSFTNTPTNNDPTLGSGTVAYTFTIHNYGASAVTLSGSLAITGTATVTCTGGNTLPLSGSLAAGADATFSLTCMYSGTSGQNVQATINANFTDLNGVTGAVSGSPTTYIFTVQTS